MDRINSPAFWVGVAGLIKFLLNAFNVSIPDELINDVVNGVAALLVAYGIWDTHQKKEASDQKVEN